MNKDTIRQASVADIPRIIDLLHQVDMVHHRLRPDLFKPNTTKYSKQELETLVGDESKPIFVYDDGDVLGYVGSALFDFVRDYAKSIGCHAITLNVWEGNDSAIHFYQNMGMHPQKIRMEMELNRKK